MACSSETHAERYMVFEQWKAFEAEVGDADAIEALRKNVPRKIKKRRKIATPDGSDGGWEEYFDYAFPDEQTTQPHLKLLEVARKWKLAQAAVRPSSSLSGSWRCWLTMCALQKAAQEASNRADNDDDRDDKIAVDEN